MGAGKAIFQGGFKFAASEARNKFDRTDLLVQRQTYQSASPSTREHQK